MVPSKKTAKFDNIILLSRNDRSFLSHRLPVARAASSVSRKVTVICGNTGKMGDIRNLGFDVIELKPSQGSRKPFSAILRTLELIKLYKRIRPDVVLHFSVEMSFIGSIASFFSDKIKTVNAITGVGYLFSSRDLKAKIVQFLLLPVMRILWLRWDTLLLFQNPDDRELFWSKRLAKKDAQIITGAGVDIVKFKPAAKSDWPKKSGTNIIVGCACRLLKDKGLAELVSAIELLQQKYEIELRIAGDVDSNNPSTFAKIDLQNWSEIRSIKLVGNVSDMVSFWRECDIAILPSHREGLPKALLEAASCGLPLIGANVAGTREVIVHSVNGLLFSKGDIIDLMNKLELLITDKAFRKSAGKESRRFMETGGFSDAAIEVSFVALLMAIKGNWHKSLVE